MNLNMNKIIKDKIYITLDNLYDELDTSYNTKKMLHHECEKDFGEMVVNETRIKLIKDFIKSSVFYCTTPCRLQFASIVIKM